MIGITFGILFAILAYAIGAYKELTGWKCGLAGFLGGIVNVNGIPVGIVVLIVLAFMPNRTQEKEASARREAERDEEIAQLKKRLEELEGANGPDTDAKG